MEKEQNGLIVGKIEEAARWDVSNLSPKKACDSKKIHINEKTRDWLDANELVPKGMDSDNMKVKLCQQIMATALDEGLISDDDFEQLTGREVVVFCFVDYIDIEVFHCSSKLCYGSVLVAAPASPGK